MKPQFFATAAALREWLEENHDSADELWLGIYKKDSGKQAFTGGTRATSPAPRSSPTRG